MKPALSLALLAAFGLADADAAPAQGRPYAPKATVPAGPVDDGFLQTEIRTLEAAAVPSLTEVEAPPYPGAVVIQTVPAAERGRGKRRWVSLPVVVLFTTDPVARVIDFYRQNLAGWTHARYLASDYFWMGTDEFNPLAQSGQTVPSVQVLPARTSRLMPQAVTEIHVRYRPSGGLGWEVGSGGRRAVSGA